MKDLDRTEKVAFEALRDSNRAAAKPLLLLLRKSGRDSVLVRKGLLDLDLSPNVLKADLARLEARRKAGERLSHVDVLEEGYALAQLAADNHGTVGLPISGVLAGLRRVLNDAPTVAERVAIGELLSEIIDLGEARRVLKEAARLAPRRAGVQLAYAWSLIHVGSTHNPSRPQEALRYALAAVREDPKRALAYEMVADCYLDIGEKVRADRYYAEYVKHGDPDSKSVRAIREDLVKRGVPIGG